ncbi:MAG TPA: CRTAC1 family protein [Thermoguttaceae bacterium]|nr:CRTAC1 family protein [Thermoguttaceae bacterium]
MKIPASNAIGLAIAFSAAAVTLAPTWTGCRPAESPRPREASSPVSECPIQLRDATGETGIAFVHTDGSSGQRYIPETVTAGLALFDYNGDGFVDVYFLNGAPLRGAETKGPPPRNALYRNEGGWRFTDVTDEAGVGDTGFGLGATVGDYDNDGDQDLFVNNYGPNVLYRNNGDGTFTDVTDRAGVRGGDKVGAGACFLDMDADGDLDLYVANYVKFTYETHLVIYQEGFPQYVSPRGYPYEPDLLYRNDGDGTFTDVSEESGVGQHAGSGMGMVSADYDRDGDTDVFVLNDVAGNFFFENDGTGRFEEVGLMVGTAYNAYGEELGSMGVDCGDYDNDGWLDLFMTSYQGQMPVLYKNLDGGGFKDVTSATGVGDGSFPHVNWGTGLVDFDNDGDRDVFIACGHLQDNIHRFDDTSAYQVRNILLMNTGDGKFVNVSDAAGDGLLPELSSRGAAFDDLDNDGDVDAVILNSRSRPTILRNDSPTGNHWIQLRLRGVNANRDGVGAQVTVVAGDLTQVDEVHSGRGYQSHWGTRLHFGLGKRDRVDRIEVRWIGQGVDVLEDVEVDRLLTITEGSNQAAAVADTRCVARTSPRKRFMRPVPPLSPTP